MAAAIGLREDYGSDDLRVLAKTVKDAAQARRLLALAVIYDGGSRTDAARIGGVGLQIIRDWVLRFNAAGPGGLINGKAPGNRPKLSDDQRAALAAVVERGPIPAIQGVVRWRLIDLTQWVWEEFGISLSEATMSRELKALGYRKISARPRHHAQNEFAIEDFKKLSRRAGEGPGAPPGRDRDRAVVPGRGEDRAEEQDHPALGAARHSTLGPHDQRTRWAYIFGAICPAKGKGVGLVMPWCDTQAMAAHLAEIGKAVNPGAHAVVIVDQAGWHMSPKLAIPDNITLMALPPRSPELNPVENIWQFIRENWLSNRVFKSCDEIVALCCEAWNKLIERPWKIISIGMRKWTHKC